MTVEILERDFLPSEHKLVGCKDYDGNCRIDGRFPIGATGVVPNTYVHRISVTAWGHRYVLPSEGMYDAWGKNRSEDLQSNVRHFGGHCVTPTDCVFRGVFSDGAETYVAQWEIVAGHAERTILTSEPDIVNVILANIDGPIED